MPNSKLRKRRLDEQRRKQRRISCYVSKDVDVDLDENTLRKSSSVTSLASQSSRSSISTVAVPDITSRLFSFIPHVGSTAVNSAFDLWSNSMSVAADIVMPSRKLMRELESTKEKLREAESKIDILEKTRVTEPSGIPQSVPVAPIAAPAPSLPPPPPPPGPPPKIDLAPRKLIIKRSKASSALLDKKQGENGPLVTADDLKKIKLRPRNRSHTVVEKKPSNGPTALVSLDQLKKVRLKRCKSLASALDTKDLCSNSENHEFPFAKRLKKVEVKRSPGGTPLYSGNCKDNGVGFTPMITRALRRKFAHAKPSSRSPSPSPCGSPQFTSPKTPGQRSRSVRFAPLSEISPR